MKIWLVTQKKGGGLAATNSEEKAKACAAGPHTWLVVNVPATMQGDRLWLLHTPQISDVPAVPSIAGAFRTKEEAEDQLLKAGDAVQLVGPVLIV